MTTQDNSLAWGEHTRECRLHNDFSLRTCFGISRRGNRCSRKHKFNTVAQFEAAFLPTCIAHADQKMFLTKCRATMQCGWPCSRLSELKTHGLHLCHQHSYPHETHAPCYFLKIPLELRIRVYGLLLPDLDIPANFPPKCKSGGKLRSDRCPTSTSILRVNRQIHDEGTRCLYGSRKFGIRIEEGNITFCNTTDRFIFNDFPLSVKAPCPIAPVLHAVQQGGNYAVQQGGNHALQDYQMQLMLLEQQNKKRLMMARAADENIISLTGQQVSQSLDKDQTLHKTPLKFPLSRKYFNQIHSFDIEIYLGNNFPPGGVQAQSPAQAQASTAMVAHLQQVQQQYQSSRISDNILESQLWERKIYSTIDLLHMLISNLQSSLVNRSLARLSLSLKFGTLFRKREEAIPTATLLLKPFLLLRNILKPEIASITLGQTGYNPADMEIDLIDPVWSPSQQDKEFSAFLKHWHETLSLPLFPTVTPDGETQPNKNSNWPLPISPIFTAYDSLSTFITTIKTHCHFTLSQEREILDFLHSARVAREAEDMTSFKDAWEQVVQVWLGYLERERYFEKTVEGMMEGIFGLVEGG